jgi:hypothetical protein
MHDDASIVRQMVYRFIAGYEDDVDANELRNDPVMPLIAGRDHLASQPTVSRCMNFYRMHDVWAFQRGNLDVVAATEETLDFGEVTLDFDTTDIPTYGSQQAGRYNGFYDGTVRQAMFCFNQLGNCVKGTLYNGVAAASTKVVDFCKSPVRHYLNRGMTVRLRADRLFGSERLYSYCEKRGVLYYTRLRSSPGQEAVCGKCGATLVEDPAEPGTFYGEYINEVRSRWNRGRRVCVRIKPRAGELFKDVTCIITNDTDSSPHEVVEFYLDRGTCENYIKEGKIGFKFSRLSHTRFAASALRLQIQILAYNINNLMRLLCLPGALSNCFIQTIRVKLIKIGARISRSARRIKIRCSSGWPYRKLFAAIHRAILRLDFAFT